MSLIDTHCHLDVKEFAPDLDQVLEDSRTAGLVGIVVPAIHAAGWLHLLELCAATQWLHPALGLHPMYLEQHNVKHLGALENLLATQYPTAIGEIGLDYWDNSLDKKLQQHFFEAQLLIAATARLPVLLHVRKAHDQTLATLQRIQVPGGIVHAFNGSLDQAHRYIDLGFKIGFGGMLTFERSRKLRSLAKALPASSLVLETDAPDLTVASHHGKRNSPAYLPECLIALAQARTEDTKEVAGYTSNNAREILHLSS